MDESSKNDNRKHSLASKRTAVKSRSALVDPESSICTSNRATGEGAEVGEVVDGDMVGDVGDATDGTLRSHAINKQTANPTKPSLPTHSFED